MALDFKEEPQDVAPFRRRLIFSFCVVILFFLILIARFAWLQIINQSAYLERAEKNRTVTVTTQGPRGLIVDRNGTLLAKNILSYSLEITPDQVKDLDATINALMTPFPSVTN